MFAAIYEGEEVKVFEEGIWRNADLWFPCVRGALSSVWERVRSAPSALRRGQVGDCKSCDMDTPENASCTSTERSTENGSTSYDDVMIVGERSRAERDAEGRARAVFLDADCRGKQSVPIPFAEKRLNSLALALEEHLQRCINYVTSDADKAACAMAVHCTELAAHRVRSQLGLMRRERRRKRRSSLAVRAEAERYVCAKTQPSSEEKDDKPYATTNGVDCEAEACDVSRNGHVGGEGSIDARQRHNSGDDDEQRSKGAELGDSGAPTGRSPEIRDQ